MDTLTRVITLLDKFTANLCSTRELNELFDHLSTGKYDELLDVHILQRLRAETPQGKGLDAAGSERILNKILELEGKDVRKEQRGIVRLLSRRKAVGIAAAACILGAAVTMIIWKTDRSGSRPAATLAFEKQSPRRIENTSAVNIPLQLEDGSHVELHPGAILTYPAHFAADKRELSLEGDAYFDVAKDPDKPFLIYHSQLITRVLGTSFIIKGSRKRQEVQVITGKVEVYENIKGKGQQSDGVIVTPNEKVTYSEDKPFFNLALADNPVLVETGRLIQATGGDSTSVFAFDHTDIRSIIDQLKDAYGVEIEVESENINNCLFTGDISDQGLFEKLNILCKTTGMTYEVKGTRILLKGNGCK